MSRTSSTTPCSGNWNEPATTECSQNMESNKLTNRGQRMYHLRALVIFAFLLFNSFAPAHSATAPTKIVVGFAAMNARVAPLWITEEQGILAKYGLQAQQVFLRGAPT